MRQKGELKLAAATHPGNVAGTTHRQRRNGQGRILLRKSGEATAVDHKEISYFSRLIPLIEYRRLWVAAHPHCPDLMAGKAANIWGIELAHLRTAGIEDAVSTGDDIAEEGPVVGAEFELDNRNRYPVLVGSNRIDGDPVHWSMLDLTVSTHLE